VADDTDEADRIVKQWHENERRDALTETDRLAAVEQLTILGVPAGNIARRLGTPKKQVEAAVQANGSDLAKTAARKHALTLTDAALVAEFEDDEDTVRDILRAVKDGDSAEHVAQRARDDKARQQAQNQAAAALVEAGVTVIDRPGYDDKTIKELREIRLVKRNGDPKVNPPTEAEHATCPGHAAYVNAYYYEADVIDDEDQPEELELHVIYLCTDPERYGHAPRYGRPQPRRPAPPEDGDANDAENAAAQWQARQDEARRVERRELIRLNKEADAAQQVRRQFLQQCLTAKPRHKAMTAWALGQVIHRDPTYSRWASEYYRPSPILTEILGRDPAEAAAAAPANQHGALLWAHVVCANEEDLPRDAHRITAPSRAAYLSHLQTIGYTLSDVEQRILTNGTEQQPTAAEQPADKSAGEQDQG
jgi:ParB family chromosome partitioning protein